MENEIKVGEYCRTKNGLIAKLIEPQVYEINDKECIEFLEDIVKHSPNLIDLIEVGDYVNGKEVEQVLEVREFKGFRGSKKFAFTHIKFSLPGGMIEDKEIRTILTKEQYMANCYKVGGRKTGGGFIWYFV